MVSCCMCKHLEKECGETCKYRWVLPIEMYKDFSLIIKWFDVSMVEARLSCLSNNSEKAMAVKSLVWEASMWEKDPIGGPLGAYKKRLLAVTNEKLSHLSIS